MVRVKCYYIRGVRTERVRGGIVVLQGRKPLSKVVEAKSKKAAKKKFREKYPGYSIVQANKRKC